MAVNALSKKELLLKVLHNLLLRKSLTPDDEGCQQYLYDLLRTLGFCAVNCDLNGITNTLYFHTNNPEVLEKLKAKNFAFEAQKLTECTHIKDLDFPFLGDKVFLFAGHTDVVPEGPLESWTYPPYAGYITKKERDQDLVVFPEEGISTIEDIDALSDAEFKELVTRILGSNGNNDLTLHGRGATDMKGGLAAAACAIYNYVAANPNHKGTLALLATSDEEGIALYGTKYVVEELQRVNQQLDWCIVGEPSSSKVFGDTIRIGRRGSATFYLTIHGTQGHVAYPDLVDNPIHKASKFLAELGSLKLDRGTKEFPATSLQVVDIHAGDGTTNLVPANLSVTFNVRFNNLHTYASLSDSVAILLERHKLNECTSVKSVCSGEAFVTPSKTPLVSYLVSAIPELSTFKGKPKCDTGGGTSDGRFLCKICPQIVELGTTNATLHKINEHVAFDEVKQLHKVYLATVGHFLEQSGETTESSSLMVEFKQKLKALKERRAAEKV